jgi:imidazolonepropionase-like amidohydrolase
MAKAYQAGVKIVMGSDAGSPLLYHGKINLKELNELVSIGMTAHEAIQSATSTAAEVLGVEESTGSVQEGKLADIIVVDGNPLDDITILEDERNIRVVIKEGEIIKDSL